MLREIQSIYSTHLKGEKINIPQVEASLGRPLNSETRPYSIVDGVAVIEMSGVSGKKMNLFTEISGGISTQVAADQIRQAVDDQSVKSIILQIDSPGGTVSGTAECAEAIFESRGSKPIITIAEDTCASAAYWIGSAADYVFISSLTTELGSIGVVARHVNWKAAEDMAGRENTEITAGKYKRIASEFETLSDEGRESIQDAVDEIYTVFVETVAVHRGITADAVLSGMADGQVFQGQKAIDVGLADGVSTVRNMIATLSANGHTLENLGRAGAVRTIQNENEVTKMDENKIEISAITRQVVEDNCPDIVASIRAEGVEAGATSELGRIQSVMAQSMVGHETLINTLAFDGKTTGEQAAVQVLSAERANNENVLDELEDGAADPAAAAASAAANLESESDENQMSPKQVAAAAKVLIATAKTEGRTLSAADAVAQVNKEASK
jgi:signal peptide peptidase SppA